jgi:hypothetical protein
MIRNETYENGACIYAEIIDLESGTSTLEEHGEIISTRPLTMDEYRQYGPQPLDFNGASAALNVVLGLWPIEDAANIAGVSEDNLITEALGWAAAKELNNGNS